MRNVLLSFGLLWSAVAFADTLGKVHPDPGVPCINAHAKAHEICFELPSDNIARAEYLSEPFFVVILETAERCTLSEERRLEVQDLFPASKVFSTRFQCDDEAGGEENITYTRVNDQYGFLAVYAGTTLKQARARLAEVAATGRFPGANLRKMQAKLVYP